MYLALPAGDTPDLIHAAIRPEATILELGSGPGRITRPLVALGHSVVAVDNSAEMLAYVHDIAETVLADIYELALERTFDAVVAGSNLINDKSAERRKALLELCRRHVAPGGVVLVERYPPEWAHSPQASERMLGDVRISVEPLEQADEWFRCRVRYTLGDRTWTQEFTAAEVTDEMLDEDAEISGLRVESWLTATWARLVAS